MLVSSAYANWVVDNFQYTQEKQLTILRMSYTGFGIDVEVRNFPYMKGIPEVTKAFLAKIQAREVAQETKYLGTELHGPLTYHKYISRESNVLYGNITVIYSLGENDITITHFRVKIQQEMQLDWRDFSSFVHKNWNTVARALEQQSMQNFSKKLAPTPTPPSPKQ